VYAAEYLEFLVVMLFNVQPWLSKPADTYCI